jgi:hypothetical protein
MVAHYIFDRRRHPGLSFYAMSFPEIAIQTKREKR